MKTDPVKDALDWEAYRKRALAEHEARMKLGPPRLPKPPSSWQRQYRAARADYFYEVTGLRWPRR